MAHPIDEEVVLAARFGAICRVRPRLGLESQERSRIDVHDVIEPGLAGQFMSIVMSYLF
jgi:hypothetical protein